MRALLLLGLLAVVGWGGTSLLINTAPYNLTGGAFVQGKANPEVKIAWSDSSTSIVRTDVYRRHGTTAPDTVWKRIGYTTGGFKEFIDPNVYFGNTYRYRLRDSTTGQALTGWSDSLVIQVVQR